AGIRQFERARQPAVIGEQQQPLGVEIDPTDRDQAWQALGQIVEHRRPPFRVGMGRHQPARLVEQEQTGALARRQRLAVDGDDVIDGNVERGRVDDAAVDADAALHDPFLGIASRGKPGPRHHLGDALTGFLDFGRTRRAALFVVALAIGAAAAERRAFCKNLAVVFILAARTIGKAIRRSPLVARMLLPGIAALARPIEFRTILAALTWAVEFGTLAEWPVALRAILA